MLAQVCDYDVGEFIWSTGDTHIYADQLDLVKKQIQREPLKLSKLYLNPHIKDINMFKSSDIVIQDYICDDSINYPIAV